MAPLVTWRPSGRVNTTCGSEQTILTLMGSGLSVPESVSVYRVLNPVTRTVGGVSSASSGKALAVNLGKIEASVDFGT